MPGRVPKESDLVLSHWAREHSQSKEAWAVHRLDRFTSGVMIFAKNESAQKTGSAWFETRQVKKIYLFLASPSPSRPAIQIKTPVDGKPSQTLFEIVQSKGSIFLGRAIPITGRFHQVREHAKDGGFPILGDASCQGQLQVMGATGPISIPRVALHAFSIEAPIGKFEAPLAPELQQIWDAMPS